MVTEDLGWWRASGRRLKKTKDSDEVHTDDVVTTFYVVGLDKEETDRGFREWPGSSALK